VTSPAGRAAREPRDRLPRPPNGPEARAIVLKCYVGDRSERSSYLLGGLIAPARKWERFVRRWEAVLARAPALPCWDTEAAFAETRRAPFDALSRTQLKRRCAALAAAIHELDPVVVAVAMSAADFDAHVRGGLQIPLQTDPALEERRLATLRLGQRPAQALHFGLLPAVDAAARRGRPQGVRLVLEAAGAARDAELDYELRRFVRHRVSQGGLDPFVAIGHAPGHGPGESRALEAAGLVAWAARATLDGRGLNRVTRVLGSVEVVTVGAEQARQWTEAVNAYWAQDGIAHERA